MFSHPPRNLFTRAMIKCENLLHRLRSNDFRAYLHPPIAMITAAQTQGLSMSYRHRGVSWHVVGLERLIPAI